MNGLILPSDPNKAYGVVAFFAAEKDGMIGVIDLWRDLTPDAQRDTQKVTDAPQVVINELLRRGFPINDRVLLYMDENDRWDQICVHNGNFDNFFMLHAESWQIAIERLLKEGVITRRDLLKEAVVGKELRI